MTQQFEFSNEFKLDEFKLDELWLPHEQNRLVSFKYDPLLTMLFEFRGFELFSFFLSEQELHSLLLTPGTIANPLLVAKRPRLLTKLFVAADTFDVDIWAWKSLGDWISCCPSEMDGG